MKTIVLAVMFLVTAVGRCQTPANDTLQSLLVEVHQLRQDIEAMTVASQRVQIALYALQMQDAAVTRAAQRLDNIRGKCARAEEDGRQTARDMQGFESRLTSGTLPESDAKAVQARMAEMKILLDAQAADVQTCQATEADASSQLRNDQAKLADVQDRIDRLDKALERLASAGK